MTTTNASQLSEFDFVVVGDASGSMTETDCKGKSRWDHMQENVRAFNHDIAKFDADGIDLVIFSGSQISVEQGVTAAATNDVFAKRSPRGSTPLAEALTEAFKLAGKSDKKDFILVYTDGVPDDKEAVRNVIKAHANKQETDDACTILFVQVGYDASAKAYLQSLDDDLKGAKFDIVDVLTMEEAEKFATTSDMVLAAIND